MAKGSPALAAFNAGEWSPWCEGRVDNDKYATACHVLSNFIPLVEGPALRRPGNRYVTPVKNSANRTWLRPFIYSPTEAWQIEFGDRYCRFYTNEGLLAPGTVAAWSSSTAYVVGNLASSGGIVYYCIAANTNQVPPNATYWYAQPAGIYEIPSPYAVADLTSAQGTFNFGLDQSGNVLYIAGGAAGYPPYTLTRVSDTNWQFALFAPNDGPFIEENLTTTTLSPSGRTGTITLTASAPVFVPTDVGRLVRIEVESYSVKSWAVQIGYNTNDEVTSNGHTYVALNSANSGTNAPEHLEGSAWDGSGTGAVQWAYEDSGYGIVQITGYTSPTSVTAVVTVNANNGFSTYGLPSSLTSTPTRHWKLGAWSQTTEYPRTVSFFMDRLYWAGQLRWWASIPGLYTSYIPDQFNQVTTDSGMAGIISANKVSTILWLSPALKLLIGTDGGEFGLGPITTVNPIGPDNVQVSLQSAQGCRQVRPQLINTSVFYVQRAGRKVMAMDYNFYFDRYDSTNQNRLAYHITQTGVCDLAYQAQPFQTLWATRTDGLLIGYTFDRNDNVTAWARHPVGNSGMVECVSVIPAPDGLRDQLWMIVNRTLNGQTVRSVEFAEKHYEPGDLQSSCFYIDMGNTYTAPVLATIAGITDGFSGVLARRTISTAAAHGLVGGQRITISGVVATGALSINAAWTVLEIPTPTTFTVVGSGNPNSQDQYTSGGAVNATTLTVTGLSYLNGQTVSVLKDGAVHSQVPVNAGSITLQSPGTVIQVGLPYTSILTTMRIEGGADVGTSQGKTKRVPRSAIRVVDTLGGVWGMENGQLDDIRGADPNVPLDQAALIYDGDTAGSFPGTWDTDCRMTVQQSDPLPMTVNALFPIVDVNEPSPP